MCKVVFVHHQREEIVMRNVTFAIQLPHRDGLCFEATNISSDGEFRRSLRGIEFVSCSVISFNEDRWLLDCLPH